MIVPRKIVPMGVVLSDESSQPAGGQDPTFHGGTLLTNVRVQPVFWGKGWNGQASLITQLDQFFKYIVTSPLMDMLNEYSVPGQNIGHGSVLSTVRLSNSEPGNTISDATLQGVIDNWVNDAVIFGGSNTLTFVFLPPGTTSTQSNQTSCVNYCGYHGRTSGGNRYAVIPYVTCSGCSQGTPLQTFTVVASHELSEAITNSNNGWWDSAVSGNEIGDFCVGKTTTLGGFLVQRIWSNRTGACVIGPSGLTVPGAGIAASRQFGLSNQTDVFVVDQWGQLTVHWIEASGGWQGPQLIGTAGSFPPGAPVAASRRFGKNQTDVFVVDPFGALTVSSVDDAGAWSVPQPIGTNRSFPPGAWVAASQRFGKNQTDVFVIDTTGALTVSSVGESGTWSFPQPIGTNNTFPPGAPVAASQRFGKNQTDVFAVDRFGALAVASVGESGSWSFPQPIGTNNTFPPGAGVAASRRFGKNQTDVFAVDPTGALAVASIDETGTWSLPQPIGTNNTFPPGAPVTASQRIGKNQTDVFAVDPTGALAVASVDETGAWSLPQPIGTNKTFPPGAPVVATQRFGKNQTDVLAVDPFGRVAVASIDETGTWSFPQPIPTAIT